MSDAGAASQEEQERALLEGFGAVVRRLDLIEVGGPQAASFLDGQLSQEIAAVSPGSSAWSFVLQPQGKVVALVRMTVVSPERIILDMDAGFGQLVQDRLERFRLRVKAELSHRQVPAVSLRGPLVPAVESGDGSQVDSLWPALPGKDLLDTDEVPADAVPCTREAWEAARITAGLPVNGAELTERTIPAESGLVPMAASLTKGCYVGQELVARIDSRGHVNRHLRRLSIDGEVPPAGAELRTADKAVGNITSATFSAVAGHPVALGYLRREVEAGVALSVRWDGSEAKAVWEPDD
ncbi:MAG: hypothetical protein KY395_00755 [Actinobacteria bacterium]|nr:hypothetical protein [Actinomycetota bacterium]